MRSFDDTICAPATIPGTGAICIIRVSGKDSLRIAGRLIGSERIQSASGYSIAFGEIPGVDQVLFSVFRAPHSYTGEDSVEISCHSSAVIVEDILSLLMNEGVRMAEPGEFTMRAFLNGKMDLSQAEAVADLIGASGKAARDIALNQLKGRYSSELGALREDMKAIAALLELELDFSEEEVEFASRSRIRSLLEDTVGKVDALAESFSRGDAIKNGIPVAIAGAPNSGKSTLLNALVGDERAIVSSIPGTTRDTIEETIDINGLTFRIVDTAGIRHTDDEIEGIGISRAFEAIGKAKVALILSDAVRDSAISAKQFSEIASHAPRGCKIIHVITKCDLAGMTEADLAKKENAIDEYPTVIISAKTGYGLDTLKSLVTEDFLDGTNEVTVVTSARHYDALQACARSLRTVLASLDSNIPADLLAEDLRNAIHHLGTITGEITSNEVLGEIFGRFCIGK